MIFKSICLAAALLAAPTNAVPSTNSTKLSNDTDEPKRRLGAVERRDLGSDTKSAFVLLKSTGAHGLGHVAGCFEEEDGGFMCFSRHEANVWYERKADQEEILKHFKGWEYTNWKRLDVFNADPEQALAQLNVQKGEEYNLAYRNCQNTVYDILHDESSGFGITANFFAKNNGCYIGWVQKSGGPNIWFVEAIAATEAGKFRSGENGKCSDNSYCASGLTCCGGTCKKKVNKRWCISSWWSWTCFDNWTCP